MFERGSLITKAKSNQEKLDRCSGSHDFQPIRLEDGSASFYRCIKCLGVVDSMSGLKYSLSGQFE